MLGRSLLWSAALLCGCGGVDVATSDRGSESCPAYLPGAAYFGKWIAYSSPTVADLNGDGKPEVYLNSASYARGGYAAVKPDGKPLWVEFHDNAEGSDGFGPTSISLR